MSLPPGWTEVGDGVLVRRHDVLDVNATLVLGDGAALVVDTLSTPRQAGEVLEVARSVAAAVLHVVNTHAHFDHCFGNEVFSAGAAAGVGGGIADELEIWATERCAEVLTGDPGGLLRAAVTELPGLAAELAAVVVTPPSRTVRTSATLAVGGRSVGLHHLGRGHTDSDLVVHVPDAGVLLAGDLVEEGAPPSFDDGWPLEWPGTLAAALALGGGVATVVPGHGAVVAAAFAEAQRDALTALGWACREGHAARAAPHEVAATPAAAPFGGDAAVTAARRAFADLDGRL